MAQYFGQTPAEKLVEADAYFAVANHIRSADWLFYSDDERTAGLIQAERELDGHLGLMLEQEYDTTEFPLTPGSSYRPDYAVMEQALFLLDNTARTHSDSGGVQDIESEEYQERERLTGVTISPQALVFLRANRIQIERG